MEMSDDLPLVATRERVDNYVASLIDERLHTAQEIGEAYARFWQSIKRVSLTGGKRIRPHLAVLAYGELDDRIVPVAAAQEFIHLAMLMHDDVIDQDFVRRGIANINGEYRERYGNFVDEARATHYANSSGVLAGDSLIAEAFFAIAQSPFDAEVVRRLSAQLHLATYEVIGGELMDVEAAFVDDIAYEPLLIYRYKTSSYSFICPLVSGAICRGESPETIDALTSFGQAIGIAFQIQDDLLGVFGDSDQTGKSTTADLREGKRTLLVSLHEQLMSEQQRKHFDFFGSSDATDEQLAAIRDDMAASGAKQATEHQIEQYFARAKAELDRLDDKLCGRLMVVYEQLNGRSV